MRVTAAWPRQLLPLHPALLFAPPPSPPPALPLASHCWQVLESELEAQKNIAPFLENRVLRRVIQTFTNDPSGDFGKWASNPRVIEMLREAKRLMDQG